MKKTDYLYDDPEPEPTPDETPEDGHTETPPKK